MRVIVFALALVSILYTQGTTAQSWASLATDPAGDVLVNGRPDGSELFYDYDSSSDSIWFRIDLHTALATQSWGVNILADIDQDQATGFAWLGPNNFRFDIIVTVWVTGSPGNYSGTVGVSDAAAAFQGNFKSLHSDNVTLKADTAGNFYSIGLPRAHLDSLDVSFDMIASVGISGEINDDIPNSGSVTIDELPPPPIGISEPQKIAITSYPNPVKDRLTISIQDGQQVFVGQLLDVTGKLIFGFPANGNYSMNMFDLPSGIYLLQITDGTHRRVLKVVKE